MSDRIYLDHNATAPMPAEVRAAMAAALTHVGNPSSVHHHGRAARRVIEEARARLARLVNCAPAEIIFTSGGTEANALILHQADALVSEIEHESVLAHAARADSIPVGSDGVIDLEGLRGLLASEPRPELVSVMWANNETGVMQPIDEIVPLCAEYDVPVHCDAVQALGRVDLDFQASGLSAMTISSHKIGGPAGMGALVLRQGLNVRPTQIGGGQEQGRRSGTENILGIVGFEAAVEQARPSDWQRVRILRDAMEARLLDAGPAARVLGGQGPRLANTSCIAMPGVAAETQVMALDLAGIAVSAGAACSSGKVKRSHVVAAMQPEGDAAETAIRISLCLDTKPSDIDRLVAAWGELYERTVA